MKWGRSVRQRWQRYAPHRNSRPRFPGYSNVSEIAAGSFATVYRAVELGTSRPVALKVLHMETSSASAEEPFKAELETLSLLSQHPNVVTLYRSFFTAEGRPVLVMELCRESYGQRAAQRGALTAAQAVAVGIKVAGALETAHRAGVLHRDLNPQNILISEFNEPVVADFGLLALQTPAQSTERLAGTATLHAAPEVLERQALSPATDVYGLASSLYELIVGRGPFVTYQGEAPASVILRVVGDPVPRPPLSAMPLALADLLESALAKDPLSRPQSAISFAESLRKIEAGAGWTGTRYAVWEAAQLAAPGPGVTGAVARPGLKVLSPTTRRGRPADPGLGPAGQARGGSGPGSRAVAEGVVGNRDGSALGSGATSRPAERGAGAAADPSLGRSAEVATVSGSAGSGDGAGVGLASPGSAGGSSDVAAPGRERKEGGVERVQPVGSVWEYVGPLIEPPPRAPTEEPPPGTRTVVMPPPTERTVIVPEPIALRRPPPLPPLPPLPPPPPVEPERSAEAPPPE
jgi:Protein kinase domain